MAFYEHMQANYNWLVDIHAITTKVIQDGNVTLIKEHPNAKHAKQVFINATKVTVEPPIVHQAFRQFVEETQQKFSSITSKLLS